MSRLTNLVKIAAARGVTPDPNTNMDRLSKVLVLIAEDVATMGETGRTLEMIEADAAVAVRAAFLMPDLLSWPIG